MDQEKDLTKDPRWVEAQVAIQQGQWEDALRLLRELEKDYPHDPRVRSAQVDVELRATFSEEQETAAGAARRRIHIPRRVWMAGVIVFVLAALGYTFFVGYRQYIAPQLEARARQQEIAALYQQAQQAFGAGDFATAETALQQLLALDPENPAARDLLAEVESRTELAALYERAVALQEQGRLAEALATFRQILTRDPAYRDVQRRIDVLEDALKVQDVFDQAEAAFAREDWETAATLYEEVRSLDVSYQKEHVTNRLYTAYLRLAQASLAEGTAEGVQAAWEAVREALRYNPGGEEARALRDDIRAYLRGLSAFNERNYVDAIRYWVPLLEKDPKFAGGLLAQQVYQAYVALAKNAEAEGNLPLAIHYFSLASGVPGVDTQEAKDRLAFLFLLITPTPTPTPTPTATPTPSPTPTFTPTPAPLPLSAYVGWIAFKTDRRGQVEIWVMRPDGCCARPVADPENYEKIRAKQAYSPDGKYRVYAESPPNNSSVVDLYIWRYDVPAAWEHKYLLVGNGSINYDPVWSPDGAWIAFVSQVTGNDEIFKVSSDFIHPQKPIQLTSNSWEWDKSPTWSPDGKYIAFWSNRVTGHKQIWVMNADGSNPRNISNNPYNDWDPVWLWPSYFEGGN